MDITDYTDDFEFLKDFYHLQGKNIDWAIIEEYHDDDKHDKPRKPSTNPYFPKSTFKPGLMVEGSTVYVDLFERRFTKPINFYGFCRKVYPAEKQQTGSDSDLAVLAAKEDSKKYVILPKSFIQDIHNKCWYAEWMEESSLL